MSVKKNIEFHIRETWKILFSCKNADGSAMDLTGADVFFRISQSVTVALLTKTNGDGLEISDAVAGTGVIIIVPADQTAATLVANKEYLYELRVVAPAFVSVQAEGKLKTLPSLFET